MKRLWKILGILLGTALLLNVVTEILNRKSFVGTVRFMIHAPMVFLLDTLLLLTPFLVVFMSETKKAAFRYFVFWNKAKERNNAIWYTI